MSDDKSKPWLATLFWIAACGNVLLVLIPALREWNHPGGEFSGLFVILMFAIVLCLIVVIAIVAAIRNPMAYGADLALVSMFDYRRSILCRRSPAWMSQQRE